MRSIILTLVAFFLMISLRAQSIWPGDVNNNGIVNAVDLLYWGTAYGAEGPARTEVDSDWTPQPFPGNWSQDFPNGLNYVFADCNGDGVVDEDDFNEAIEHNFGESNPPIDMDQYANAAANAPKLRLTPSATLVQEGAMVSITLSIDTTQVALDSFYGIALQLSYTTGLLEGDDGPDFDLVEGSWLESDSSYVQELFVDNDDGGTAQLAITRTNQQSVIAQSGIIGHFDLIVEDIIVGLEVDTFILSIDSILLINEQMDIRPIIPDTARIVIAKDTSKLTGGWKELDAMVLTQQLQVYPNPADGVLLIESPFPIQQLRLIDTNGILWAEENGHARYFTDQISVAGLPSGMYWLQILTVQGVLLNRRIIVFSP